MWSIMNVQGTSILPLSESDGPSLCGSSRLSEARSWIYLSYTFNDSSCGGREAISMNPAWSMTFPLLVKHY